MTLLSMRSGCGLRRGVASMCTKFKYSHGVKDSVFLPFVTISDISTHFVCHEMNDKCSSFCGCVCDVLGGCDIVCICVCVCVCE